MSAMDDEIKAASGGRLIRLASSYDGEDLGASGQYGSVFPARHRRDELVAVKWYRDQNTKAHEERFLRLLKGLPHIVSEVSAGQGNYMAMEVAYNGNLASLCEVAENIPLPTRLSIARDICTGLQAMHHLGIAHEDLKPENVLLDYGLRAKLCDFGSSIISSRPQYLRVSGTRKYWSPEKEEFLTKIATDAGTATPGYDRMKADIYSLGLILEALQLIPNLPNLQQLGFTERDPTKRPDWVAIFSALGKRSFNYKEDQLMGITEAELVNMAYCWTHLEEDCCDNLVQARKFFCNSKFSEAFRALRSCLELCDGDDNIITRLLMGTLLMYGLGTKMDKKGARDLFEKAKTDLDEHLHKPHYVQEFAEFLMLTSEGDTDATEKGLLMLAGRGNPLAQNALSSLYLYNSTVKRWDPVITESGGAYAYEEMESTEKHYKNNSLRFLCKAATSGFALSQACLTLMYWENNTSNFVQLRQEPGFADDTVRLPKVEKMFLKEASEAGSLMAHLLLGVVDNNLDKEALEKSGRADIVKFLAMVYSRLGDKHRAVQWLDIGAYKFGDTECLHKAGVHLSDYNRLKEVLEQTNYRLSAFECALILQKQGNEAGALSCAEHHLALLLTEEDMAESRDEANFRSLIPKVLSLLLQLEENSEAKVKGAWYELILRLEDKLGRIALASVGEYYRKKNEIAKAIYWHTKAFEKGYFSAAATLGILRADEAKTAIEWWKLGEEKGCPICLQNLMANIPDKGQRVSYLQRGCEELKAPRFIYEYAVHLLEEGKKKEALQCFEQAIDSGYEDATFFMALNSKDNVEDLEYWMGRYLRNIHADYAGMLGAQLQIDADPLSLLLWSDKQGPLHPDAFWRLGVYYMLAKQQEKAIFWFIKGAANREPKCSSLYGTLLRRRDDAKRALSFLLHALLQHSNPYRCLCEIIQCLNALGLPGNSKIVLLIAMNILSDQFQVLYGADHDNEEGSSSSSNFTTILFNKLARTLPGFGAEEEALLGICLHSSMLEKEKAVGLFLKTHKKEEMSVASLYILSMLYVDIGVVESLHWLAEAFQADTQFSDLLVEYGDSFPPPGIGLEFSCENTSSLGYLESMRVAFLAGDENSTIKIQLAQVFSISSASCKISNSVSNHASSSRPHSWETEFQLPIPRSHTRGLLVSVYVNEPTTSTMWLMIKLNQWGCVYGQAQSRSAPADCIVVMVPRRAFQNILSQYDDDGEDLVQVDVMVSNFESEMRVEKVCLDVVTMDMQPCLEGYIKDLKSLWNETLFNPLSPQVDRVDACFSVMRISF